MVRLQPSASKCVLLPLLGHWVDGGCGELSRGDHKVGVVRGQSRRFFDVRRDCPICVRSASMPFNCYRSKNSPPSTASATNGVDYFSPEMLYEAGTDAELAPYAATVNWLLGSLGQPALGRSSDIGVRVRHADRVGDGIMLGSEFRWRSPKEVGETVALVYGDSERWIEFLSKRERDIGVARGIAFIVALAVRHFTSHVVSMTRFAFEAIGAA